MKNWDALIEEAGAHWGLGAEEIGVAKRMLAAESVGQPGAVSPKGAMGLMQLMPETAREMGVKNPHDPKENIFGGVGYFKKMLDTFGGDVPLAVAAYNAGPGRVREAGGIPAIRETQDYVAKVLGWGREVAGHVWGLIGPSEAHAEELADPYMVRRQEAEEQELMGLLMGAGAKPGKPPGEEKKAPPAAPGEARGPYLQATPEEIEAWEKGGAVADPDLDIMNVIGAFAGTAAASGLKTAATALIGNIVGELGGGFAKTAVEKVAPRWGWVAGLAVDIAAGMATDKAVQKAASRIRQAAPEITEEAAKAMASKAAQSPEIGDAVKLAQGAGAENVQEVQKAINQTFDPELWEKAQKIEIGDPIKDKNLPAGGFVKEEVVHGKGKNAKPGYIVEYKGKEYFIFKDDAVLMGGPEQKYAAMLAEKEPAAAVSEKLPPGSILAATARKPDFTTLGDATKPPFEILPISKGKAQKLLKMAAPELKEGKYAVNINLNRIEAPEEIAETINKMSQLEAKGIDKARRGVISHEETARLADMLDLTPEKLLARRSGQAFNAEEALAARRLLVASAAQVRELAVKASSVNATEVDMLAFRRAMAVMAGIQQQVSGMTAEAGRTLSAFRIMAEETELASRAVRDWLDMGGGPEAVRKMAEKMAGIEEPEAIAKVVSKAYRATKFDVFMEAWINGLLSNPVTHAVNFLSNMATALVQVPERKIAAKIGKHVFRDQAVADGEASVQLYGMIMGFLDGLRLAGKSLVEGQPSGQFASKLEVHKRAISADALEMSGVAGRAVDLLGEAVRLPGKALVAADELWKAVGYRMELHAQAMRLATKEGLEGEALGRRMQEIIANPPEHLKLAAIDAATYQTYTQKAGPLAQRLMQAAHDTPALRLIVPFIRTPANIMKFGFERTPLAPLMKHVREDIMAGGARRDMALARVSLGSMVMAAMGGLSAAGLITGGGPEDPKMKEALRRTGWQPYSVKIGEKYYSYGRLEPIGMIMGLGASFAEIAGQAGSEELDEVAGAMAAAAGDVLVNKTWLTGLSNLIQAVTDPERYGRSYLQKFAGTLIPLTALTAQIERTQDPTLRETRAGRESGVFMGVQTMVNEIKSRLPGYSKDLPPRRNLWGEPIVLGGGLGPDMVSPIYTSEARKSPIDDEIIRLKIGLSMPGREIMGVELSMEEYDRYTILAGQEAKKALDKLVNSGEYRRATDEAKEIAIRKTIAAYREAARGQVIKEYPELKQLIREKLREAQ